MPISTREPNRPMLTGPPSATAPAKIIFLTDRHTMLAEMSTGNRRVSDVVNDPLRRHLTLDNVRINRSDRMDESVGAYAQVTVRREAIQGVLIMSEPPRAPQQRLSSFVAKTSVRVAVLLPAMLITGNIYVAGKADAALQALEGTERFAVINDATVTLNHRSSGPIAVPTAMVSRCHMELATVAPSATGSSVATESARP